ncbi:MAG TPA: hypothetical protein VJT49_30350 [Amycolatopsis sp.]|uniref:hypothetical protein n=1 Tax=Amycolatopsis sp. TaxID=37632 RepID=UPI002B4864AD|nr:hypothetical protein [Amycolatopsis sp.]HKS49335.1 hypothetical protein [Amycolatopsis sp.]
MTKDDSLPGSSGDSGLAGPVIAALIVKEAEKAEAAAGSVQSRGLAVISSSGTLVTLLFGLAALATKVQNFVLPGSTKLPLCLSALFLVLAAVLGIATNLPRGTEAVALRDLRPLLEDRAWNAPAVNADQQIARTQLTTVESTRKRNIKVARLLITAISLEIVGIACVMWSVLSLIFKA